MIPETIPGIRLMPPFINDVRKGTLPAQMILRSRLVQPCINDVRKGTLPAAP